MIKVLFMGRKNVAANALAWLSEFKNVKIVGVLTDSHLQGSPTTKVAKELGYKLYDFDTALKDLKDGTLKFDFGVSILYWRRLKDEFLTKPSMGIINFHPAPLPDYKGTGGYNFAILDKLSKWAVSAHYVDEGIDTGEIIQVDSFCIDSERETCSSLEKASMQKLEEQIKNILTRKLKNKEVFNTLPNIGGRYISRKEMEAAKEIKSGDDIDRKIRAFWFPPYDGAYIIKNGRRYTLINKQILQELAPKNTTSLFAKEA